MDVADRRVQLLCLTGLGPAWCRGTVVVRYAAGRRTVSSRRVAVRSTCRFASRVAFASLRRLAGRRRLRVSVRFEGNPALRAATARPRTARVR